MNNFAHCAGMLAYRCGPAFAGLTGAAIAGYTAFTIGVTQWRTRFRQACALSSMTLGWELWILCHTSVTSLLTSYIMNWLNEQLAERK